MDPDAAQQPPQVTIDCADEPIRIPGSVQPHGVLLGVDRERTVLLCSQNTGDLLGRPSDEVLGHAVDDVLGPGLPAVLRAGQADQPTSLRHTTPDGTLWDVVVRQGEGLLLLELEQGDPREAETTTRTRAALVALQAARTEADLTRALATHVRLITGFDRVMVYRFDPEWNGEVVAEDRRGDLEPFLGLHYPASDIPAQARALYTSQWLRSIPDAGYTPVPLEPAGNPVTGGPLDLSDVALRSVSPVHLQYLANMGVAASMSVSLVVNGRLWGLIACHHYAGPHYPGLAQREGAEFLGRTGSVLLQGLEETARVSESLQVSARVAAITRSLAADDRNPLRTLEGDGLLLTLADGVTGAVARVHGTVRTLGETPEPWEVDDLLTRLGPLTPASGPVVSRQVGKDLPDAPGLSGLASIASGVLAVPVPSGTAGDYLAWFKPEVLRDVHWAGDPDTKGLEATPEGLRLAPRASFAAWVEQVRGTSTPWSVAEQEGAEALARNLGEMLARRSAEDGRLAAALQQVLLTTRPAVPEGYELVSRYRPSGRDVLGGDWFDVTPLADGRVVLMVGDVAGHGMGMAAVTAQMRHALRAYLVDTGDAAAALAQLGSLVATLLPGELATVSAVELVPKEGRARVISAGHLPPVVVGDDGARLLAAARGPALGLGVTPRYRTVEVELAPGEALLQFTDGLVEERRVRIDESLQGLVRRTQDAGGLDGGLEALCDRLLATAPAGGDDVTVLAVRRLP